MIVIIDYGVGNLGSIYNMLKKAGAEVIVSGDHETIMSASKIILPGVGAFDNCMEKFTSGGFKEILDKKVMIDKTPILGICVGLQMMTHRSEEGKLAGLGWIAGETKKFDLASLEKGLKIPHMGWAEVKVCKKSELMVDMFDSPRFYFVHSYYIVCDDSSDILMTVENGYSFVCAVERGNISGVQFHPEKSHKYGLKLLSNFANK